jgi:uncharacterized protein YndB with AHSA1/START domain
MRFVKFTLVGLVSVTLAFLSLGFFHKDFKYDNELIINSSPEKVYAAFTNEELKYKWLSGYSESESIAGKAFQPGHRKLLKFEQGDQLFEMTEELKEIHEEEKIVFSIQTELFTGLNEVYFMGSNGKCTLTSYTKIKGSSIFYRAMFYMLKSSMQNQTQLNYEALKMVVESENERPENLQ